MNARLGDPLAGGGKGCGSEDTEAEAGELAGSIVGVL
jgi:hypothetical protein